MGTNWDAGLLYWRDHVPRAAERYSLTHLHPFIQTIELATTEKHSTRVVQLHVSFGLHTFTRAVELHDEDEDFYRDNREVRAFCPARYQHSMALPGIIRTLEVRRCEFARGERGNINYVTIDLAGGDRYAAFFDLRRMK